MMQKIARSIIQVWLLSVAILISGAHYNVAQAQDNPKLHRMAVACGKELRKQCGGGAVAGVQLGLAQAAFSRASKRYKKHFPQDALHWRTMLCARVMPMQRVFARASSRVPTVILSDA
jgi:hypothetical protein